MKLPSGCLPTCSRQEGCDDSTAAHRAMNAIQTNLFIFKYSILSIAGRSESGGDAERFRGYFQSGAACWRLYSLRSTLFTMSRTSVTGRCSASAICCGDSLLSM